MYDFFEFGPIDKKTAVSILIWVVLLVVAGSVGYMCGLRNAGKDIPDHGNTVEVVGNEIDTAGSSISAAESGIDHAAAAADRIENRIEAAQERVEYIKGTADEGRRIIAECQSILRAVRSGGKEKAPQN